MLVRLLWTSWCKDYLVLLRQFHNLILWLRLQNKNDLSVEQTAKEWACSEYIKRSTIFLAQLRILIIRTICLMSILVA